MVNSRALSITTSLSRRKTALLEGCDGCAISYFALKKLSSKISFLPKQISISIAIGLLSQSNLHYDWLLDTSDRYTPVIQLRGTLWMYHADNIKSILGLVYWTFSYGIVILLGITALGGSFIGGKWDWVKSLQNIKHLPNCAFSIWYTRFQNCCIMIYCHAAISKQIDKHLLWAYRFAGIVFGSQMYLSGASFH